MPNERCAPKLVYCRADTLESGPYRRYTFGRTVRRKMVIHRAVHVSGISFRIATAPMCTANKGRIVNKLLHFRSVARGLGVRRSLQRTGSGTRRSGELGSTFLTGVDRRVHAPLGTVMKFSSVVYRVSSPTSGRRCVGVVVTGGRLLLRLVSSVLSLSGVRTNAVSFSCSIASVGRLVNGVYRRVRRGSRSPRIRVSFVRGTPTYIVGASEMHLSRIVVGLVDGTVGFARQKDVSVKCHVDRTGSRVCFFYGSANVNVTTSGLRLIFRHFIGLGTFIGKAKLKLTVYQIVMRHLKKAVNISSGRKRKTYF